MARPNRFNNANPVRDLQRRQADGLGAGARGNFSEPAAAAAITPVISNTAPWTLGAYHTMIEALRPQVTRIDRTPPPPFNWYDTNIDTRMANRDALGHIRDHVAARANVDEGWLRTHNNPTPRMWDRPVRTPDLNTNINPHRVNLRGQNTRGTFDNYTIGVKSQKKAERTRAILLAAMAMGNKYDGKLYHYSIVNGIGTWYVGTIPVAEVDAAEVRLVKIMLPKATGNETLDLLVWNKTRFLWRLLKLKAVRYKDKTVVSTEVTGEVMMPGEVWYIAREYFPSYVADSDTQNSTKQGELFETDGQSKHLGKSTLTGRTKPVNWVNVNGTGFIWNEIKLADGQIIRLNEPTELAEEATNSTPNRN